MEVEEGGGGGRGEEVGGEGRRVVTGRRSCYLGYHLGKGPALLSTVTTQLYHII